jgi:hypothetical protein
MHKDRMIRGMPSQIDWLMTYVELEGAHSLHSCLREIVKNLQSTSSTCVFFPVGVISITLGDLTRPITTAISFELKRTLVKNGLPSSTALLRVF